MDENEVLQKKEKIRNNPVIKWIKDNPEIISLITSILTVVGIAGGIYRDKKEYKDNIYYNYEMDDPDSNGKKRSVICKIPCREMKTMN